MLTMILVLALVAAFQPAFAKLQRRTPTADYVFVLKQGGTEKALRSSLKGTQISKVRDLGNSTFQVLFKKDPGLKTLQAKAKKSKKLIESVQNNLKYEATLPPAPAQSGF